MIQCADVEQNRGPDLKYADCVETVGMSFKDIVNIFSLNCRSFVGQNSILNQLKDALGKTQFLALQKHGSKWMTRSVFGNNAVKISNVLEKIGIFHYKTKQIKLVCCSIYIDHSNQKNVQILPPSPNPVWKAAG